MARKKRFDSRRRLLKSGEYEKPDGSYIYKWSDRTGKRHSFTAKTLEELRTKETKITVDKYDGIRIEAQNVTVNDLYRLWCALKCGLKDNTFQNYKYMYEMFVAENLGKLRVQTLKKSDVKRFYNYLMDERGLKSSTVDSVHTVLHQVLQLGVEDQYMRINVSDNVLREVKQAHNTGVSRRKALTIHEQQLFLDFLKREDTPYHHWESIFTVMLGTGMRVGEVTGLRWCDIDLEECVIDVNHTLVYYSHADKKCRFNIHSPKTSAGIRQIPIIDSVRQAFLNERIYQQKKGIKCKSSIDGYTDFIFINRYGEPQHQGTLNKALRRIIRDCNDAELNKNAKATVLLPPFSCHSLRHTYSTRLVESGVNLKVIQQVLGHREISTTLDIYTDVTKDLMKREFEYFNEKLKANTDSFKDIQNNE